MNTDFTVLFSSIGDFIEEILDSTITSNIVAIVSLVVTFQTMKSAKDIKEEMEKMQIDTLEKSRFMQEKPKIIKSLERHRKSITKAGKLSSNLGREVLALLTKIEGHKKVFKNEDYKEIEEIHEKTKTIINKDGTYDNTDVNDCIELIVKLKNILNKGDYSL